MSVIADLFLVLGAAFIALGGLGLVRMPDLYNRLQAGTKTATLGTLSLLLGVGLHHPEWWPKLLVVAGFVLFTNPLGSSTIARAAFNSGFAPWRSANQGKEE